MEEEYYSYIQKFFAKWATVYDRHPLVMLLKGVWERVVEVADAEAGSKILDVATGTGRLAFAFSRRGYEVTGIDLSEDMLRVARRKNKDGKLRFEVADATDLPFRDGCFDVCTVSFALHDMSLIIREKAVGEMARVTRSGGTIVIADYGLPTNRAGRYIVYHFINSYETKYYGEFITSDIGALLEKSGIIVKEEIPVLAGVGGIWRGMAGEKDT